MEKENGQELFLAAKGNFLIVLMSGSPEAHSLFVFHCIACPSCPTVKGRVECGLKNGGSFE